jgi:hypothetical protein
MLDINIDCPSGRSAVSRCHSIWNQIRAYNDDEVKPELYFILPFCYVHRFVYKYRPLLPLAMARPSDMTPPPGLNAPPLAFKFVFCPGGIKNTVHRSLKFLPNLPRGFLTSATYFMQARFKRATNLEDLIENSSSIWLLGIVKMKGKWSHQILGGVIYTSCAGTGEGIDAPASFVYYVAVQEPLHDDLASENCPGISQECYDFPEGEEFEQDSKDQLRDYFGAHDNPLLGSRRMGVMLLSIVQTLSASRKHGMCHLYLQSLKQTFAYRRYIRLGFKYSTLHQKNTDGSSNTTWPCCRSTGDLPENLCARVLEPVYCSGDGEIHARLLD